MINLSAVATEVFQVLHSFDYSVMMYDDEGMQVYEPEEARRMFAKPENLLVSITDENDNSAINLYLSGKSDVESVLGLIDSLRTTANKYNMLFNDKKWDRDLTVKDFASKNAVRENKEPMMDLTEGMYGTSRSSYLKLENARMIVRHSAKIDENVAGSRSRRIDNIFVENAQGERFLFPTKQLAPARAMTQHFNHGGGFADQIGQQITQMATDYSALSQASSFIGMNQPMMAEGAQKVREACRDSRKGMRKCFERLYRESSYDAEAEALSEAAQTPVLAEDAAMAKLRETLAVEGKELADSIIEAVARCTKSGADEVLDEADDIEPEESDDDGGDARTKYRKENGPTINVLGHEVDLDAWNRLKAGNLELRTSPESLMGAGGQFRDPQAALGYKLGVVCSVVISDSLFKLLSWASERLSDGASGREAAKLSTLANSVLQLASVSKNVQEGLGFRGSEVIREFEQWYDSMGTDKVLGAVDEVESFDEPSVDAPVTPLDAPVEPVADLPAPSMIPDPVVPPVAPEPIAPELDFGAAMPELSTGELGSDFDLGQSSTDDESMAADISLGYTEGENWRLDFAEKDTAAAQCGGEDAVLLSISAAVLGGSRNGSVHSDPSSGARQSFAWSIEPLVQDVASPAPVGDVAAAIPSVDSVVPPVDPIVAPALADTPVVAPSPLTPDPVGIGDPVGMSDDMMEGDGELTREDILLPKDPESDLKQEVGATDDSDEDKQLTVERLRKLSGIRISQD